MSNWLKRRFLLASVMAGVLGLVGAGCGGGGTDQEQDISKLDIAPVFNEDPDSPVAGIDLTNESEHMEELGATEVP